MISFSSVTPVGYIKRLANEGHRDSTEPSCQQRGKELDYGFSAIIKSHLLVTGCKMSKYLCSFSPKCTCASLG